MRILYINKDINLLGDFSKRILKNNQHNGVIVDSDGFWNNKNLSDDVDIIEVNSDNNLDTYDISLDSINDMNIVLNDNDCSDTFFQDVCSLLENDGVSFSTTSKCQDINKNGSIIITIDQQYNSGMSTLVFAPYDNTRVGESDALALCMYSALRENGIMVDDIVSGKTGFREEKDGSISEIIPTEAEDNIDVNSDSCFVTVSLGTQDISSMDTARSIENALLRLHYYMENHDYNTDLMYRAKDGEDVSMIADYFHTSLNDLRVFNHLGNEDKLIHAKTIVNPSVKDIKSFDYNVEFQIKELNNKTY